MKKQTKPVGLPPWLETPPPFSDRQLVRSHPSLGLGLGGVISSWRGEVEVSWTIRPKGCKARITTIPRDDLIAVPALEWQTATELILWLTERQHAGINARMTSKQKALLYQQFDKQRLVFEGVITAWLDARADGIDVQPYHLIHEINDIFENATKQGFCL